MKERIAGSLAVGAAVAAGLVAFEDTYRHAALAAAAARPLPHGGHQTVAFILTTGFTATTLAVAVVVFAVTTVAGRRRARARATGRDWQQPRYPQERRGRAGTRR